MGPTDRDLAHMASLAYSDNLSKVVKCTSGTPKCVPKGYNTLIHQVQAKGQATFQGVAALNPRTRDLIIAYRGTWTAGGVHSDIGLFKSAVSSTGASCLRYAIKTASGKACKDNSVSCWGKYVTGIPCRAASQVDGISRLAYAITAADKFYRDAVRKAGSRARNVHITGHSLGGYLAAYVGAKYKRHTVTFNAPPGARYALANSKGKMAPYDKVAISRIKNYRRTGDTVSSFAGPLYKTPYGHTGKICKLPGTNKKPLTMHGMAGVIPLIKSGVKCVAPSRSTWFW